MNGYIHKNELKKLQLWDQGLRRNSYLQAVYDTTATLTDVNVQNSEPGNPAKDTILQPTVNRQWPRSCGLYVRLAVNGPAWGGDSCSSRPSTHCLAHWKHPGTLTVQQ